MERLLRHVAQRVNFDQGISLSAGFLTLRHNAFPVMVISGKTIRPDGGRRILNYTIPVRE
jgi:hypothetical protein